MQLVFEDRKVEKILYDTKLLQKKVGLEIGQKVRKRLNEIKATNNFNEYLTKIKLGKPHPLEGEFKGCYGVWITSNYRMIVQPLETELDLESLKKCDKLNIKGVLDYHGGKNEWIIP